MAKSRLPIDWHPVTTLPILGTGVDVAITARPCRLYGFSLIESTGAGAAIVRILDGGNNVGAEVASVSLSPGQSVRDWFGQPGILIRSGLFLNVISGQVRGAVWPLLLTEAEILKGLEGNS